jgi:hypothetical protein
MLLTPCGRTRLSSCSIEEFPGAVDTGAGVKGRHSRRPSMKETETMNTDQTVGRNHVAIIATYEALGILAAWSAGLSSFAIAIAERRMSPEARMSSVAAMRDLQNRAWPSSRVGIGCGCAGSTFSNGPVWPYDQRKAERVS